IHARLTAGDPASTARETSDVSFQLAMPPSPASWKLTPRLGERTMRMAAIPIHRGDDSRLGVNHAYPWPHLLDLCRQAGLVWMRDWSLKWQDVEPEKGRFTFTEPDYQIDRPRKHGL